MNYKEIFKNASVDTITEIDLSDVKLHDLLNKIIPSIESEFPNDEHIVITKFVFTCEHHSLLGKCEFMKFVTSKDKFNSVMNFCRGYLRKLPSDTLNKRMMKSLFHMYFRLPKEMDGEAYDLIREGSFWTVSDVEYMGEDSECTCLANATPSS